MDIFNSWLTTTPIAHRGLHNETIPENSLASFDNAIKHNYPIELDVKLLDDGNPVVFHDDKLCRMCGTDGYITNLTAQELNVLRLNKTSEHIPLFKEVLDFVDGKVPLLIEIKNTSKVGALEKAVLDLLKNYKGEFAVQSFNPWSLEYFKKYAPDILRGQLSCSFSGDKSLNWFKRYMLRGMKFNKSVSNPHFISYEYSSLPNTYVNRYKKLPVLAWTVRSNSDYELIKDFTNNIIFEGFVPNIT